MRSDFQVNDEPLPGYRLISRLGAGGYGEVWRAEAPGGLNKAIKLVFGEQHEKRAVRELRALELIRQLRHPFLLAVERIEIVDGRLLIVTELADESVKDRFDECVQNGLPGIPREEILRYVRDAADALDYMSGQHGLQHLDIKPENLLIVADHVKVADFGLVKDVQQSNASLVAGMTPLYAAPEVFRGVPGRQSDQYALAIVYHEMLTGVLPFAGRNAAELTLQHLNDEPDLSALDGPERFVISRALSKDASHRYATCREFVEALCQSVSGSSDLQAKEAVPSPGLFSNRFAEPAARTTSPTELFEDDGDHGGKSGQLLLDMPTSDRKVINLPPIQVDGGTFRPASVLFLGIGGSAGRVLWHLRSRMNQRFGDEPIPAVQMLLVDTDPQALADVTGIDGPGLTLEETLNIPLRRPQHYRERWDQLLSWLSRRWLYNIPKSMRTEGLRPLGRLAFVDHARQTCQRIRRGMLQAGELESVTASTAITGHEFRGDALRIYIVASVSGGTGSGAVLDVAFAVQAMLKKIAVQQATVTGILMHSTGRDPRHGDLARVNAFSWLTEYQHFQQPGTAYPGDASCGLPAHDPSVNGFDQTYFLHLGDGLDDREFDEATSSVAEYLLLDALSPAQVLLDACRAKVTQPNGWSDGETNGTNLRSCGLHRRATFSSQLCGQAAEVVSKRVLANWLEKTAPVTPPAVEEPTGGSVSAADATGMELVARLHLNPAGISAQARSLIESHLGCEAATFLCNWLAERLSSSQDNDARRWEIVDDIFGAGQTVSDGERKPSLMGQLVADIVQPMGERFGEETRQWVIRRLDLPGGRFAAARQASQWMQRHFESLLDEVRRYREPLSAALVELRQPTQVAAANDPMVAEATIERLTHYFELRLDALSLKAAEHVARSVLAELKTVGDDLTAFGRELAQVSTTGRASATSDKRSLDNGTIDDEVGKHTLAKVRENVDALAVAADTRLQCSFLDCQGGLFQVVMRGGRPRAQLSGKIQEVARYTVEDQLADMQSSRDELGSVNGQKANESKLRESIEAATPRVLEHWGDRRVIAVVPRGTDAASKARELSQSAGVDVSVVEGSDGNTTLCVEAEHLSLAHLALGLVERRRESVEFAKRVQSRSDIAWTPLLAVPLESHHEPPSRLSTISMAMDPGVRQTEVI
jgi:eukaryotic-like serine/threonine-protein kinase